MVVREGIKKKYEPPITLAHIYGELTEWLGRGLQILVQWFESITRLYIVRG